MIASLFDSCQKNQLLQGLTFSMVIELLIHRNNSKEIPFFDISDSSCLFSAWMFLLNQFLEGDNSELQMHNCFGQLQLHRSFQYGISKQCQELNFKKKYKGRTLHAGH